MESVQKRSFTLLLICIIIFFLCISNAQYFKITPGLPELIAFLGIFVFIIGIFTFISFVIATLSLSKDRNKKSKQVIGEAKYKNTNPYRRLYILIIVAFFVVLNLFEIDRKIIANFSLKKIPIPTSTPVIDDTYSLLKLVNSWRLSNDYEIFIEDQGLCKYTLEILDLGSQQSIQQYFDKSPFNNYTNVYGVGSSKLSSSQEILNSWIKDSSDGALTQKNKYSCLKCNNEYCYLLTASLAPSNSVITKSTNIDCTGPDGKHFQTNQKACDDFNAAWGTNKTQPSSYTKIVIPKYTSTNIKTIPCLLSVGVYQLTESDCAFLKIQDTAPTRQPLTAPLVPTPNFNSTNSNYVPTNASTLLNNCINNAVAQYNQRMSELSALGTSDSSVGESALNTANAEISQCYSTYQ